MQCTAEGSHSSSASKTLSYHGHFQGLGMQFMWSWRVIHFSLITVTDCPPKYLSRKHFGSYHMHEEGLLDSRRAGEGRCKTQSWCLPFAQPLLFYAPRTPPRFRSASRAAAGSRDCAVITTYFIHIMSLWMWNSGRLGQIHSLPMSSKRELHPVRPAASPLAPAGVNHASVEPDSSGEITL